MTNPVPVISEGVIMKKLFLGLISVIAFSVLFACTLSRHEAVAAGALSQNQQAVIDAMKAEAEARVESAGKPAKQEKLTSGMKARDGLPETLDLRAVDKNGDGITENYVTSVKQQRPFGSCWSFATISASEISILYEMGREAVDVSEDGIRKDAIDLSEHHLAWFIYTAIPEADSQGIYSGQLMSQAGEGLYSQVKDADKNASLKMGSGSTQFAAAKYFASGIGPVEEPDFNTEKEPDKQLVYCSKEGNITHNEKFNVDCYSPDDDWSVDETLRFTQSYMLEDSYMLPSPVSIDEKGNYDKEYADTVSSLYKEQIMQGRAVSICFCSDTYRPDQDTSCPQYINSGGGTWAHYTYSQPRANHAVTVVGWDDNYSVDNFLSEIQVTDKQGQPLFNADGTPKMKSVPKPPADGAWIVKNSWGAENSIGQGITDSHWGVDGSGFFYLSYYDTSIETAECFDFDVENRLKAELGEYEIDEYDLMPTEMPKSVVCDFEIASANVFTTEDDEMLRAVCCTTTEFNEEVKVVISVAEEGADSVTGVRPVLEYSEEFEYPGLHIINLPEDVELAKGQIYAIAVTQLGRDGYLLSIGSEFNQKGFDAGYCDDNYAAKGVVNSKESYIYLADEDTWWDFADVLEIFKANGGAADYLTYDNFPIKGYASISVAETNP